MDEIQKNVIEWLVSKEEPGYDRLQILKDLQQGGCQSGMVRHLVYHTECVTFCSQYWNEIQEIVNDIYHETGDSDFLFGKTDGFSFSRLAWIAFEHVAFKIYIELEESEAA